MENCLKNLSAEEKVTTPPPPVSIDNLPDVALVNIFQNLAINEKVGVELVSKRWQDLSRVSWKGLTELDIGSIAIIDDHEKESLILLLIDRTRGGPKNVSLLRRVAFKQSNPQPFDDEICRIFRAPSPRVFQALATHCPELDEVEMDANYGLELSEMCLPLSECANVKKFTYRLLRGDGEVLSTLVQNWRQLRHLEVFLRDGPGDYLRHISSSLISLEIDIGRRFTKENVERVISNCFRLESLTLCYPIGSTITDAPLRSIRHLKFLKHLDIKHTGRPEITSIFHEKLDLVYLAMPRNLGLAGAQYFEILSLLPALRHFHITATNDTWDNFVLEWINTDAEIIRLRRKDAPLTLKFRTIYVTREVTRDLRAKVANHVPAEIPWTFEWETPIY